MLLEAGYCRKRINQHLGRIRRMFKWGVAREMVPEGVWRAICAVEGLRKGEAPDTEPVKPVSETSIQAIQEIVTPQIWAMIQIQLWTGCRPEEICLTRMIDVNMQNKIWEYRPHSHKTEHYGKERVIFLGPHAQEILKSWFRSDLYAYLFSPAEARKWFFAERATKRKTPKTPSQNKRRRKANPKRKPGNVYTTNTYGHAIRKACEKAKIPPWSPNQLRHTAATRIRSEYGIEAARILLGHSSAVTSEIYAEIDRDKARAIVEKIG
jgi:integrase